jgi:hypothetical protein
MELRKNISISDTGFVFDAATGESFSLNPIGLEILNLLKSGTDDDKIKEKMTEKYDVDGSTFDLVYFDFIRTLQQFDLLEKS